jgi:hypothetical protein
MGKRQTNSQLLQPNAPVLPKKERDVETELQIPMEDVTYINNIPVN